MVLVARTRGGLEDVDDRIRAELKIAPDEDSPFTLLELDLTDLNAVDRIGPTIAQRFGKLDIVVGNAGLLGEMSPMHQ